MKRHYIVVAGKKFYCDEKGVLSKDAEGNFEEKPATDTEAVEVAEEEATEEVAKMLKKAAATVLASAEKGLGESQVKAVEAIDALFKGIGESAKKHTKVAGGEVKTSFNVDDVKAGIASLASRQRNTFSFSIKSTSELNSLTGDVIQPEVVTEITRDPVRAVFIESIADVTPNMTSDALSYVEVVSESGAPLATAELGTIPEKDFEFQEFKAPLKKLTVMNKHSVEILSDAPQLVSAIKGWLNEDINILTDQELINGIGTGDHLQGIIGVAEVLDATAVGTKRVAFANLADVIRVALTKVAVSGKGKFLASHVLLNPEDADALDLTKDENGQYVLPPFRTADGTTIKGAKIIENVGIPAGKFVVGDFRKLHIGTKGGVEIEMTNSDGTDFAKDILAVKLRRRVAAYVRQNDSGAFWTGTIATVIDALTNPS
jgi:HK97 family phage major capsid protein